MKKILKIHRSIVIIIGIIAAITLLALTTGLRLCIVRTTSMEPTITPYSVCLVTTRVRYEDLSIGDIVVFTRASDGEKVVHRVVEMTDEGVITRGDANRNDDGVSVTPDTLFARYIMHIPYGLYLCLCAYTNRCCDDCRIVYCFGRAQYCDGQTRGENLTRTRIPVHHKARLRVQDICHLGITVIIGQDDVQLKQGPSRLL